jgi:hypothetical protein
MTDYVFPKLWKDLPPGLDEWIWSHINSNEFEYGAFAFEVQTRHTSLAHGSTLEFGYYLAHRSKPGAEPEVVGCRTTTRCPGRELLVLGLTLSEHILPEQISKFEFKMSREMLSAIHAEHERALEPTPA